MSNYNVSNINIYYQNVRGLSTKLNVLLYSIAVTDYDVIVFTETWFNMNVGDLELGLTKLQYIGLTEMRIQVIV